MLFTSLMRSCEPAMMKQTDSTCRGVLRSAGNIFDGRWRNTNTADDSTTQVFLRGYERLRTKIPTSFCFLHLSNIHKWTCYGV